MSLVAINMSIQELRAYQHYRENTMMQMLFRKEDDFWDGALLRMSHDNRFLECLVVSLSSLDEAYRLRTNVDQHSTALKMYAFSLDEYQQGINGLRLVMQQGQETELILAAILVCTCVELWHGDYMNAIGHVTNGLRLARSELLRRQMANNNTPMSHLDMLQSMLYRVSIQLGVNSNTGYIAQREDLSDHNLLTRPPVSEIDLYKQFHALMGQYITLTSQTDSDTPEAVTMRDQFREWHRSFLVIMNSKIKQNRSTRIFAMQYHLVFAMLEGLSARDETLYDKYLNDFEECLKFVEPYIQSTWNARSTVKSSRTLESNVMMALGFVVLKCRDRQIRRKALRMLYRCRSLEGLAHSVIAGIVLEQVIAVEEGRDTVTGYAPSGTPADIDRVQLRHFYYDPGCLEGSQQGHIMDDWKINPPSLTFTYEKISEPGVVRVVRINQRPHASVPGFGLKSCVSPPNSRIPQPLRASQLTSEVVLVSHIQPRCANDIG